MVLVGVGMRLSECSSPAQGTVASLVSEIFEIQHGYFGTVLSNLAKVNGGSWCL